LSKNAASDDSWLAELERLLERHPRATWPSARSATAAFWLGVHEHLRRDAAGLAAASDDYRDSPARLAVVAAPRLRGLIAAMHGHHQVEDFHYFPEFRRTKPALAAGFDRLEHEHASLSRNVEAALAALGELRGAAELTTETVTQQLAAQRYIDAAAELCVALLRHLDDEENLVVPLLLEGGIHSESSD
jgi:hypothetical protein